MKNKPVKLAKKLSHFEIEFLSTFSTSCRRSILQMTSAAKSGHPGGSLSSLDYLSLLYTKIISSSNETVVISNGHISPAVYAILAELGVISKKDVLRNFRSNKSIFEGHVSRAVPGIWYGTGPLGTGASAGSAFALAQKLQKQNKKVFLTLGDGETQEGQVYEMMNFAAKYKLNNLIAFLDFNEVQLSGSLKEIMPYNPIKIFTACGWEVIESPGHDFQKLYSALLRAYTSKNKPVLIVGHTTMGKGISFMEKSGRKHESTWHGSPLDSAQLDKALLELSLPKNYAELLEKFKKQVPLKLHRSEFIRPLTKMPIHTGKVQTYSQDTLTDCRSAYGRTLLDLATLNKNILALTADLSPSVKTDLLKKKFPSRHVDCGIAEQHMLSCAGGLSLAGYIPFASTFGAFMTSRAKDQARVNDINETNVKMVATHCGLSVGEDGPTHQAIDDVGSMLGLLHTHVIEPADPNHTDHIIRYIASHYGNFYVRMGRHKIPILTKTDGSPFFDAEYHYEYGKSDILRIGHDLTVCASGSMVSEAFKAYESLKKSHPKLSIELIIVSSAKKFDNTLLHSIQKTKKVLSIEDHNTHSGFGSQLARTLVQNNIATENFVMMGVDTYQMSGTSEALYENAQISSTHIEKKILEILHKPRKNKVMTFLLA